MTDRRTMTDKPDLDELRRLLDAATPGPWEVFDDHGVMCIVNSEGEFQSIALDLYPKDAALIVWLRNNAEALLRERDALQARVDDLESLLPDCLVALNAWICAYASEFCLHEHVEEAHKRIADGGGTLAYIGKLNGRIQDIMETHKEPSDE